MKPSGIPFTGTIFVEIYTIPRKSDCVANVTINGGRSIAEMIMALIAPQIIPSPIPLRIAKGIGTLHFTINVPIKTPIIPTVLPTDRSIPPDAIINVYGIATIVTTHTWRNILNIFLDVKKFGLKKAKIIPNNNTINSVLWVFT
jgi:hypothetical protein